MVRKITIISSVILFSFILSGIVYGNAATNNDFETDITTDNFIGSTTATWGGPYLDWGAAVDVDSEENIVMVGYSETAG